MRSWGSHRELKGGIRSHKNLSVSEWLSEVSTYWAAVFYRILHYYTTYFEKIQQIHSYFKIYQLILRIILISKYTWTHYWILNMSVCIESKWKWYSITLSKIGQTLSFETRFYTLQNNKLFTTVGKLFNWLFCFLWCKGLVIFHPDTLWAMWTSSKYWRARR